MKSGYLIVPILLAALFARFLFPEVDPPYEHQALNYTITGELFTFEGNAWAQDARNRALFGTWVLDKWPTSLFMPLHNLASYLSFSLFGVGLWQARLPSMLFGLLTTLLLYVILRHTDDEATGLLSAFFWGTNYLAVALNKTALIESGLIFMTVVCYGLWHWGRRAGAGCFLFGSTAVLCVLYKPTGLIIPATGLCVYLLEFSRKRTYRNLALFLLGAGCTGFLYLVFFQSRLNEILTFYSLIGNAWRPKSLLGFFMSGATFTVSRFFFFRQPILCLGSLLWLAWLATRLRQALAPSPSQPGTAHAPADRLRLGMRAFFRTNGLMNLPDFYLAMWFLFGLSMPLAEGGQNPMLRRYMFLLPPMAVMTAKFLRAYLGPKPALRIDKRPAATALFIFGYIVCFSTIRILFFQGLTAFRYAHLESFLLVFAASVLGGVLLMRSAPVIKHRLNTSPATKTTIIAFILSAYFCSQAGQFFVWAADRQYTLYESNRRLSELSALQQPVIMAGSTLVISASFLSGYRTLVVGSPPNYMNWENILTSPEIEYYLLNQAPYREDNPILIPFLDRYPDSVPVAEITLGRREAIIYRKVETGP